MFYVYFMSNSGHGVIYTGSTVNLPDRVFAHKNGAFPDAFTLKYNCFLLVWYEEHISLAEARKREYLIKRWRRDWKERLINEMNPQWKDLSESW